MTGATHGLRGERTLMRIAVTAADRYRGHALYHAIVELLRARGFAGATVLPCIMGFGAKRILYSELNEIMSMGLPVVVEAVESEERIAAVLPELDRMIRGGVVTLERARVLVYRAPANPADVHPEPGVTPPPGGGDERSDERRADMSGTTPGSTPAAFRGFKGERVLMRIHIGEGDRWHGEPLYFAIVRLLRERHFAGATVFRGVLGFGAHARLHEPKLFRLSSDLPIVVECIETEANVEAILPELDAMIGGGLITLERARVILYRPDAPERGEAGEGWAMDVTGDWRVPPAPGAG